MNITSFTPVSGLVGGLIIGLAAALFLALNGRIAGISGAFGSLLSRQSIGSEKLWFIGGLLLAAPIWMTFAQLPTIQTDQPLWLVALAGLMVGYFTRMGSGCTSGHGVCGLSRLSARSLVATLCFMGAGFATVAFTRHGLSALGAL